jgi:hypothetical protein
MENETVEPDESGGFLPLAYSLSKLIPIREDFSRADKAFIGKYGNFPINKITVCRTPINKYVSKALNVITLGLWQKAIATYGYDNMFHLYLLIDIIDTNRGNKIITAILEKNETPRCHLYNTVNNSPNTETMPVSVPADKLTLNTLLTRTISSMGTSFWVYSAFKNNCQDFLMKVLSANNIISPPVAMFIKQNAQGIVSHLPSYTQSIAQSLTDTARRVRTLFGRGLPNLN